MRIVQSSTIHSPRRHTLRGLHYQEAPHAENKLVRCTRGSIFLVMVDLRPDSPTCSEWLAAELSARSGRLAYVPEGFAQGYQTLEDDTEVLYQMSHHYVPEAARGVRWDDPALDIDWPPADQRLILSEIEHGPISACDRSSGQPRHLQSLDGALDHRIGQPGAARRDLPRVRSTVALVQHPEQGALVVRRGDGSRPAKVIRDASRRGVVRSG